MPATANRVGLLRGTRVRLPNPLNVIVGLCFLFALRALLLWGLKPVGSYDEGLLFTNAQMLADGRVLYRDIYSNYPPGIFQIVRGLMALGAPVVWGTRVFCFVVRLASALLAGWAVGRVRGTRVCWATATVVLMLQTNLGLVPNAYSVAVALALAIIGFWPQPGARRMERVVCGLLLGCLSYLRHDLFVYAVVLLAAVEALCWSARRHSLFFGSLREFAELAGSTATWVVLFWVPVFASAGFGRVVHDIFLDQIHLTMPARVLPIPALFDRLTIPALDLTLPALIAERLRLCLAFTALGVLAGGIATFYVLFGSKELTPQRKLLLLLSVFAAATLPQALGRTDYWHVAFGLPLVLAVLFSVLGRRAAQLSIMIALLPWFAESIHFIGWSDAKKLWRNRNDSAFMEPDRVALVNSVNAQVGPLEPIFVGCVAHRRVLANALDVYYWLHRPAATRYAQFDPGLVTGAQAQSEMIADLKRTRPKLLLRAPFCAWDEPNASMLVGARLLDDYLRAHYARAESVSSFQVWRRKDGS